MKVEVNNVNMSCTCMLCSWCMLVCLCMLHCVGAHLLLALLAGDWEAGPEVAQELIEIDIVLLDGFTD